MLRAGKLLRRGFLLLWGLVVAGAFLPVASQQAASSQPATTGGAAAEKAVVDYLGDLMTKRSAQDSTIYLIGNVAFHHNGTFIQCDSAHRYDDYRLEGFGNVIINKDSTFIYGDRVSYDGHTDMATVYSPLIKLVNGDLTMWVNDLIHFNTETSVGHYDGGAVITQRDNLMESDRGIYNGDSALIVFAGNVALRNDNYVMKTDSIAYDLDEEIVHFLTWTYIWDKERDFLQAERGRYVRETETYHFTKEAYAMTADQEFWADTMNYETAIRLVTMFGNVQILDTTQSTIALGDQGHYSDSLNKGMLTRLPAVISYEVKADSNRREPRPDSLFSLSPEGDTVWAEPKEIVPDSAYMRADTIFFDSYPMGTMKPLPLQVDSLAPDSMSMAEMSFPGDSIPGPDELDSLGVRRPFLTDEGDSLADPSLIVDSLPAAEEPEIEYVLPQQDQQDEDPVTPPDSGDPAEEKDLIAGQLNEEGYSNEAEMLPDSLTVLDSLGRPIPDSTRVAGNNPAEKTDSLERVIRAYYDVKMYRSDFQGVADSVISYSADSSASFFGQPIIWSENNQLTADRINLYTANGALEYAEYIGEPFLTQKVEGADSLFNQAQSRYMESWFRDNEMVRTLMSGNVENFYYMSEENQPPDQFFVVTAATLTADFEERQPVRMNWGGSSNWVVYPIDSIPADQPQRLSGFSWEPELRPKDRFEITTRSVRPSVRRESEKEQQPDFVIEKQLNVRREELVEGGTWRDRSELLRVTLRDFQNSNLLF